ncbi:CAAX protease [Paenibacillus selenitireducens]|uniref:CAAX protease n=1 Tax=Paenibacillus selenitireducens TaxID=1324314 RepID=A0A1T2XE31_9BACL|nr:type II CAAX endopeptidase family protein [Paenibacillus selenitireducens]OPA77873.1 CAAX protease [Paenibacillus selenitireducens]
MLNSLSESNDTSSGLKKYFESRPLTSFFIMAYLFSWIILIPFILSQWNILPDTKWFSIFFVANAFVGPMLSSYIMIRTLEGKEAWRNIGKSIRQVRVGLKWYVFSLLVIPAIVFLGMVLLNGELPTFHGLTFQFFVTYPINLIVVFFGGGPFPEEIGWRGFALPRMQSQFGPLKATLLLGILWAFWHLPHFLTSAQKGGPGSDLSLLYFNLPNFIVLCLATSIILTWVYNCNQGNLFIVMLVHASLNTFSIIQPYLANSVLKNLDLSVSIGLGLFALIILFLTRGNLGYKYPSELEFGNKENISK